MIYMPLKGLVFLYTSGSFLGFMPPIDVKMTRWLIDDRLICLVHVAILSLLNVQYSVLLIFIFIYSYLFIYFCLLVTTLFDTESNRFTKPHKQQKSENQSHLGLAEINCEWTLNWTLTKGWCVFVIWPGQLQCEGWKTCQQQSWWSDEMIHS